MPDPQAPKNISTAENPGSQKEPIVLPVAKSADGRPCLQLKLVPKKVIDTQTVTEAGWGIEESGDGVRDQTSLQQDKNSPRLWMQHHGVWLALVLVLTGVAVIALALLRTGAPESALITEPVEPTAVPPESIEPRVIVERFLSQETSLEDRLALLRQPFNPDQVRKHFTEHRGYWESGVDSITPYGQSQMLDIGYHGYYVHFGSGEERYVCAVEEPAGFKIDWDAFARTNPESWVELLNGDRPWAGCQVFVVPGNYYNHAFSDPQEYSAFVLTSPDCDRDIFGYARRHSPTEKVILHTMKEVQMATTPRPVLMKLRLESVDGSHGYRQFLIEHVVASSWVASSVGTVEDLWVDSADEPEVTIGEMVEIAGMFEAPLMYRQGLALQLEDPETAIGYFRKALENQDNFHQARVALGAVLAQGGQVEEAEAELKAVLREEPTNPEAHYQLAVCALITGNMDRALGELESTLRIDPYHVLGSNNLAWLLATHDDPSVRVQSRVVELAERAARLGNASEPSILATLAVAYAAAGRFEDAVETTGRALGLLGSSQRDRDLEAKLNERLLLFQNDQPFTGK